MSTDQISKSLFKAKALDYLRRVESTGEVVIVTDNGRPTVEIRRYRSDVRTPLERLRGTVVSYHEPMGSALEGDWEALT